jgi:hypothetical protein
MYFQPFKSSVRIYRTFFRGINGNSGGEKEKQEVPRWEEKSSYSYCMFSTFLILSLVSKPKKKKRWCLPENV